MSIIYLLIPLSILTASVFLGGFIWAVRSGQYEDTCTPAMRLLAEDSDPAKKKDAKAPAAKMKPGGVQERRLKMKNGQVDRRESAPEQNWSSD
jgi:cbb3-type cytochrome oxidase maturation protein